MSLVYVHSKWHYLANTIISPKECVRIKGFYDLEQSSWAKVYLVKATTNNSLTEFIEKSHEMYQSLHQTQRSPRDPVVVPSGSDDTKVHQNSHHPGDGVDATQYFRAIYPLCDRSNFRWVYLLC